MKNIYLVTISLVILMTCSTATAKVDPFAEIQNDDCDTASRALAGLIQDIKDEALKASEKRDASKVLKKNIQSYNGDPEKCVLVSPDFVRVLSIDALSEFKNKGNRHLFEKLLKYYSKYRAGDVRQHAALALAKIRAKSAVPKIMATARDKQTYRVGYRENIAGFEKPTIEQMLIQESRDLRMDPYSFPITESLQLLAKPNQYELFRKAIIEELNFKSENKSNWNQQVRTDMLRIAASLNPQDASKLITMHKGLSHLDKLLAYAFVRSDSIIHQLEQIINELSSRDSQSVPLEVKLAFYMLSNIKTAKAKTSLKSLSGSIDQTVGFMGKVFLAKKGDEKALKDIKAKLPMMPEKLKIEGIKTLAELGDRNSVPIIKSLYKAGSKRLKTYAIWALTILKVTDLKNETMKLMVEIKPSDERKAKLDMIGTLKKSATLMQKAKPVY